MGNLTFEVIGQLETESNFMIAQDLIHVQAGVIPNDESRDQQLFFTVRFPMSHSAEPNGTYRPWSEGGCFPEEKSIRIDGTVWDLLPFYCTNWIMYDVSGDFPVVLEVERVARNDTAVWIETLGDAELSYTVKVASVETELQFYDAWVIRGATMAALFIALVSVLMQLFAFHHAVARSEEAEVDALSRELDDEAEKEVVEYLVDDWIQKQRRRTPPPPPVD